MTTELVEVEARSHVTHDGIGHPAGDRFFVPVACVGPLVELGAVVLVGDSGGEAEPPPEDS